MSTESFIDSVILGDNIKAKTDFNDLIYNKTQDQINSLKTDLANRIFQNDAPEEMDFSDPKPEIEGPQGSDEKVEELPVQEQYDLMHELQSASVNRNAELQLESGEIVPVDFKTAEALIRYMSTLNQQDQQYFLEDITQNERGLLKGIEIAFHEVGE